MLTIPHCKECLSQAYVTAVVGKSRNKLIWSDSHDYGVDGYVRILDQDGSRIREIGQGFDFQTKTTVDWSEDTTHIIYDLEAKSYNDLVCSAQKSVLPFFLILLCLHRDEDTWLQVSEEQLVLRKCAFWYQAKGNPTENTGTTRIRIPKTNIFNVDTITKILSDIRTGDLLP